MQLNNLKRIGDWRMVDVPDGREVDVEQGLSKRKGSE